MRILIIGPSWIGDMVMSQSLYRTLKVRYPQSVIDVIAPLWSYPLLSYMPEVNETSIIPISHGILKIKERWQIGYKLRKNYYDCSYVLPNSFKSALIPFFSNIPHRIGWLGEMRYGLLNDIRIMRKKAWPLMVQRYIALAYDSNTIRNAQDLPKPLLLPQFKIINKKTIKICNTFNLLPKRKIIGLCPGAEFGPAKQWPYYHYAELAKLLINEGYQIILFGSLKEDKIGEKIFVSLSEKQKKLCHNLMGKTQLDQTIILISICKLIISNDSGLMHVAAALNRPLIALYGPSSPNFTPPLSDKAKILRLINGDYEIRKGDASHHYHHSLIAISPKYVLNEINNLISKIDI